MKTEAPPQPGPAFGFVARRPETPHRSPRPSQPPHHRLHHRSAKQRPACGKHSIIQSWNYPKQSRYNGMAERFNRTVQEECIDWRLDELATDIGDFNLNLMGWLVWYDTERPHHGFGLSLKNPIQYFPGLP